MTLAVENTSHDFAPLKEFPSVFEGLGCLEDPYTIHVDSTVTPVIHNPRQIPVAFREELKKTLAEMEEKGVIKKVDQPTDWVNSLVIAEKPKTGKLRICLDPRDLNKAIKREHFQLPTIEDITTRLAGAKVFSKLDANSGYWQIILDESSQLLTTFHTPFGRYCFRRMPFGIKSAQEVFQKRIAQHFDNMEGVEVDIDDILVWGRSEEEHNKRLRAVLQKCKDINLTLNKEKCLFNKPEIVYIGHVISQDGVKPDGEKVDAIMNMPPPTDKKGVERLLGTVNYLAKFIPNMSVINEPIRQLLRSDTLFTWGKEQENAFKTVKEILSRQPVLTFFNVNKPVCISVNASKCGLGAVLTQDKKPIAYASRALTETENRYAQIEKELLDVTFGLERFHQYIFGMEDVTVENDHKPLESILKKPLFQSPSRLQRLFLRLQKYTFELGTREDPG